MTSTSVDVQGRSDVLVIGGGVLGVCCAYFLRESGRDVHLVDQEDIAEIVSKTYPNRYVTMFAYAQWRNPPPGNQASSERDPELRRGPHARIPVHPGPRREPRTLRWVGVTGQGEDALAPEREQEHRHPRGLRP